MIYDVAIIGVGVVGAMVARELTRLGQKVVLLEKASDVAVGASRANSGIVHAGFDAKEGSLKAKFNVAGAKMMESVCRELGVSYNRCGSIVAGFNQEDYETLQELLARGVKNGVEGLELVDGDRARELEPGLSPDVTCALWAPTGAVVCPYELTIAATGVAMNNGAELKTDFEVTSITKSEDGFVISNGEEAVNARFVVNCAGTHADKVAKMVGDDSFTITPRRGEYILLDRDATNVVRTTVFMTPGKLGKGILVSITAHGNVILGPTAENVEDRDDVSTTKEGLGQVRALATKSVKNIPFGKGITVFCGLRAVGSTGDFIINCPTPGFVNCAGIESPGLSSSPAIAEYVAELLQGQGATLSPKADFDGHYLPAVHFRHLSDEEKNEYIQKDSRYGRVICRCETVTEGEIVATIHQNPQPRDLDALKRRTRCGMGRCQGGFCTPYVTEILARELGVDELSLTRSGGASQLLVGKTKESL